MRPPLCLLALIAFVLALATQARAHFLFVKIKPFAESGQSAEVYFSEQAEAGDPKFIDKIANTELWLRTSPDSNKVPLRLHSIKAADRLRAPLPLSPSGILSVFGVCEYGVLARPKQTPFLLRYYPKAVAGKPEELNQIQRVGGAFAKGAMPVLLEIMPTFESNHVRLVAYRLNTPIPNTLFSIVDSDLTTTELPAGPDGAALWTPPAPGSYSIYIKDVLKTPGEYQGKPYDEIRQFATLALTWPLDRHDADPDAVSLFKKALSARAAWPSFPGFSAQVSGTLDGRPYAGKVSVTPQGSVEAQVDDPVAAPWIKDQLSSIVMHRIPDSHPTEPILRFADADDSHPLGRLLTFQGGRFASSYRIKNGQISVVNRHIGDQNMTITVLDNTPTIEAKSLPHTYLVHYWNAAAGTLNRVESVQEQWSRVGPLDLPTLHNVSTTSSSGLTVRSLELSNHKLLKPD